MISFILENLQPSQRYSRIISIISLISLKIFKLLRKKTKSNPWTFTYLRVYQRKVSFKISRIYLKFQIFLKNKIKFSIISSKIYYNLKTSLKDSLIVFDIIKDNLEEIRVSQAVSGKYLHFPQTSSKSN